MKFLDPKTGWKTYAVCAVGIGFGVAEAFGFHIPGWVDWVLVFLGGAALRNGVKNQTANLAATLLQALTVTDPNSDTTSSVVKTTAVEVHVLPDVK